MLRLRPSGRVDAVRNNANHVGLGLGIFIHNQLNRLHLAWPYPHS